MVQAQHLQEDEDPHIQQEDAELEAAQLEAFVDGLQSDVMVLEVLIHELDLQPHQVSQ